MTQIYIPAGEFLAGSSDSDLDAKSDENPQRSVYLDAFWIDQTEVTNAMYARCVNAGACTPPARSYVDAYYYFDDPAYVDHPVVNVVWQWAAEYCAWAGGRLPYAAEWEKAARGEDGRIFPWGDTGVNAALLNYCDVNCSEDWRDVFNDDGYDKTAPVGSYPAGASPYGALDMAGNVWEWVQEQGAKGGGWDAQKKYIRAAYTLDRRADYGYGSVGFRCVR